MSSGQPDAGEATVDLHDGTSHDKVSQQSRQENDQFGVDDAQVSSDRQTYLNPASPSPVPSNTIPDEDQLASSETINSSTKSSRKGPATQDSIRNDLGELNLHKMYKFSVYMTASRFYIIGGNLTDDRFRVLKIDRMTESNELIVAEDAAVYSKHEMNQLLNTIDEGNRSTGGLKLRCTCWGLLGFIKFTGPYYMLLIMKRSQVAMIGGHYIYQVDDTELVSLARAPSRFKQDRHPEEMRFLSTLHHLDLSKSFYFSYSYDVTHTLQNNIIRAREGVQALSQGSSTEKFNSMFVWNKHLIEPVIGTLKRTHDWCLPIVHGYVNQATLSVYGRVLYMTVIARRSRIFAGARFLKRGANDLGYVANDVETEQIVSDMLTTSFHAPGPKAHGSWSYTSFVQHRGSIPVFWTQDNTGVTPKPPIELNVIDPFYAAAGLHFDNLFQRYGNPVYVLNLVKARERTPRESKLLKEFTNAVAYLNQFLPPKKRILYKAWDMSRASKSRDQDVIETLESIAEEVVSAIGFFRNGDDRNVVPSLQQGVIRTNCIDCLDRTNAAQFVVGKRALGHQLHALGVIAERTIDYDTDVINLFTQMYHEHGDTLAIQYGGSHLVNTMETYRKMSNWTSHSRDIVETFKRYYHNSFLDSQRQEAYNLFLGNYIFAQGQPTLWDLPTDHYLHHTNPKLISGKQRRSYINWVTVKNLRELEMPPMREPSKDGKSDLDSTDDYWLEYYRPLALSSFQKMFAYRMKSTSKEIPAKSDQDEPVDLSPFRVRNALPQQNLRRRRNRGSMIGNESDGYGVDDNSSQTSYSVVSEKQRESTRPLWPPADRRGGIDRRNAFGHLEPSRRNAVGSSPLPPTERAHPAQRTLEQLVHGLLEPTVTRPEAEEYQRYLDHPQTLAPVVSTNLPSNQALDFAEYLNRGTPECWDHLGCSDADVAEYTEYLTVSDNPLTVTEADAPKKRYQAYRQWLKGNSLFKQQRTENLLHVDGKHWLDPDSLMPREMKVAPAF